MIEELYELQDVGIAAYLRVKGVPFKGVRFEGRQAYFQFSDPSEAERCKNEMYSDEGEVSALAYKNAVRDLTTLAKNR